MKRLAAVLLAALALAGRGGQAAPPNTAANVQAALLDRLKGKLLSVQWVACVPSGREFRSEPVYRCKVDFGDPHLESYCGLLLHGALVTHLDEPALRCARERTAAGEPVG